MNRFIRYDKGLEQAVKQIVSKNFPAVDLSGFSGFNLDTFRADSPSGLAGGEHISEIVERSSDPLLPSRRYMVFTNSRWGGSTVVH
jgi:hypothetical protein